MQTVMLKEVLNDLEHCTDRDIGYVPTGKQCCSDNNADRNSLIVFVCYLTPFCFFVFRSLAHSQNEVSILAMYVLENVEHCGGEPERADTGIFMSLMSG